MIEVFPTKLKSARLGWVWAMVQLTGPHVHAATDDAISFTFNNYDKEGKWAFNKNKNSNNDCTLIVYHSIRLVSMVN